MHGIHARWFFGRYAEQKKKLDPELAVTYTQQVAIGLDEAYKRGIVHQDIKPSNLMIAENERLKIVDFGLGADFA